NEARKLMPQNDVSELMVLKAKYAKQADFNKMLRERKADQFTKQLNDVDLAALSYVEDIEYPDLKKWQAITDRRLKKYGRADNSTPSDEEVRIKQSLSRTVSLHFDNAPLSEVAKRLGNLVEINIMLDPAGLDDEGISPSTTVSMNLDGVRLKT